MVYGCMYYFTAKYGELNEEKRLYMGKDRLENVPLIEKSHPKNLWFHTDKLSSAHVYVQLSQEEQLQNFADLKLDESLLEQVAQLTKANSIKGLKMNNVSIIYTTVDNLRSDGSTEDGTVTFINPQKVKRIHVAKKENSIINRLNKTKQDVEISTFVQEQEALLREWARSKKEKERGEAQREKEEAVARMHAAKMKKDPYGDLYTEENLRASSNEFRNENWVEDEFW